MKSNPPPCGHAVGRTARAEQHYNMAPEPTLSSQRPPLQLNGAADGQPGRPSIGREITHHMRHSHRLSDRSTDRRGKSGVMRCRRQLVDLTAALASFDEPWSHRTVAVRNDYDIRVLKTQGEFTRHRHPDTEEVFLVLSNSLTIPLDDADVTLGPGQLFVVPRRVEHQPISPDGAEVLLAEPNATVNTGDAPSELTVDRRVI